MRSGPSMAEVEVHTCSAERYLIVAILEQAISDCRPAREYHSRKPLSRTYVKNRAYFQQQAWKIRAEATAWIFQADDPDGKRAFSFEWCCYALGQSPARLRRRIAATLRGHLSERAEWINLTHKYGMTIGRAS